MAIQGIQVPMYTKHTLLLYFSILFILFYIFIKKNKSKLKRKTNKNKLNKTMHKTSLTQNNKVKHTSNANKNKKRREKKW